MSDLFATIAKNTELTKEGFMFVGAFVLCLVFNHLAIKYRNSSKKSDNPDERENQNALGIACQTAALSLAVAAFYKLTVFIRAFYALQA